MAIVQIEGKARAKFLKKKQWIVWEEKEVQSNGKYVLLKKLKVEEKCLYGLWVKKVLKEEIGNWKKVLVLTVWKLKTSINQRTFVVCLCSSLPRDWPLLIITLKTIAFQLLDYIGLWVALSRNQKDLLPWFQSLLDSSNIVPSRTREGNSSLLLIILECFIIPSLVP